MVLWKLATAIEVVVLLGCKKLKLLVVVLVGCGCLCLRLVLGWEAWEPAWPWESLSQTDVDPDSLGQEGMGGGASHCNVAIGQYGWVGSWCWTLRTRPGCSPRLLFTSNHVHVQLASGYLRRPSYFVANVLQYLDPYTQWCKPPKKHNFWSEDQQKQKQNRRTQKMEKSNLWY